MKVFLAIDGGTTNTRISVLIDGAVTDTYSCGVGAGTAADKDAYAKAIREGISLICSRNTLLLQDLNGILAAGMITSELGLFTLEHIAAPVGIAGLHRAMKTVRLPEICSVPFTFIPGVKTDAPGFEGTDMMRGEEAEIYGLPIVFDKDTVIVLPGTHSKIIRMNADGEITDFCTQMSGELLAALSQHTILRDTVDLEKAELNREWLLKGYTYCRENGINKTLFKVRILKNKFSQTNNVCYSFLLGSVLCDEIDELVRQNPARIVIAGQSKLKQGLQMILAQVYLGQLLVIEDRLSKTANATGMVRIHEYCDKG